MEGYLPAIISSTITRLNGVKKKQEELHKKRLGDLKSSIEYTKAEIDNAMKNFDNVIEPKLVDFYIYKIQAEQNRYEQLLSEYKIMEKEM